MKTVLHYGNRDVARAFGFTLRASRKERHISQDALSAICDFDRTYPSLLERGLRGPTIAMLLRLAEALDAEAVRLLADTQARLRGASPINDRLYRLAPLLDGRVTPIGGVFSSLEEACAGTSCKLGPSSDSGLSPLTVVIYEAVNALELSVARERERAARRDDFVPKVRSGGRLL